MIEPAARSRCAHRGRPYSLVAPTLTLESSGRCLARRETFVEVVALLERLEACPDCTVLGDPIVVREVKRTDRIAGAAGSPRLALQPAVALEHLPREFLVGAGQERGCEHVGQVHPRLLVEVLGRMALPTPESNRRRRFSTSRYWRRPSQKRVPLAHLRRTQGVQPATIIRGHPSLLGWPP